MNLKQNIRHPLWGAVSLYDVNPMLDSVKTELHHNQCQDYH